MQIMTGVGRTIEDYKDIQSVFESLRTLTNEFKENLPHPQDLHSYIMGLIKIR